MPHWKVSHSIIGGSVDNLRIALLFIKECGDVERDLARAPANADSQEEYGMPIRTHVSSPSLAFIAGTLVPAPSPARSAGAGSAMVMPGMRHGQEATGSR